MNIEELFPIKGYNDTHAITKSGKIWSYKYNKFMKTSNHKGYMQICLCKKL